MDSIFSDRITDVPQSFIREILKVAIDPSVISFAGGLPNRELFPFEAIKQATETVFRERGRDVLQYSNSEGLKELREYISFRYKKLQKLDIPVENILITNGSQQGLDLMGKVLINRKDEVVIEEPGYLGAIQAFSLYKPHFNPVRVDMEGMDLEGFGKVMAEKDPKLIYTVPNFQNPAGISYSESNRESIAAIIGGTRTLIIQDDPYGDLRFKGEPRISFKHLIPDNTILLGSFSKTIVPSFRIGWIVAPPSLMEKLIIAKQASDLHTNLFTQEVIYRFLKENDLDEHIKTIVRVYGSQKQAMTQSIGRYFPSEVTATDPEGGMFLWATLPENLSAMELFNRGIKQKVAFVPGHPFYINRTDTNTLRLNFSCVDGATIEIGIKRLGNAIKEMIKGI